MKKMTGKFTAPALALILAFILAAPAAEGAEGIRLKNPPPGGRQVLTLEKAIARALRHNAAIKEAEANVNIYRAKQSQADAARWPQIEVLGIVGPVPAARGNHISSPDRTGGGSPIGIFQSVRLTVVQPLFTFGLIRGLREASRGGVRVQQEGVRLKKAEIILKVHEYYYGAIAATEVYDFLTETRKTLTDARRKLLKLIKAEKGEEIDLFKLDAFSGELTMGLHEAEKNAALAREALRFAAGFPPGTQVDVAEYRIRPIARPLQQLPVYQEMSLRLRPEIEQVEAGIRARRALVKVERSKYWPQIFAAVFGSVANADNRTTIRNPFIVDRFNHEFITAVVGFKWSLNFGITKGRVAEARAEVQKLEYTRQRARKGIPVQVKKAFLELIKARKNIIATEKSYRAGKKWMVSAVANFDLGIGAPKEIFEALGQYVKMRVANLQSIYNHNISFARLERASGSLVPRTASR